MAIKCNTEVDDSQRVHALRAVFNAVRYLVRSGCGWRILALPPMEGRGADVRFPADGRYRLTALRPAKNRYDLLRRVSFSFWHLGPFLGAQSLIGDGSVRVRQVR